MNDILQLSGQVEIRASDAGSKTPRVAIAAYGGGPMQVEGWGTIAVDLAGLNLPGQVPILADHNATLKGIIGHGQPSIRDGQQLLVDGTLATAGEAVEQIIALAKGGFRFGASIGIVPTKREWIRGGNAVTVNNQTITASGDGIALIRAGTLKEISIVALAADSETSVQVAATLQKKGTKNMSTNPYKTDEARGEFDANPYFVTAGQKAELAASFSGGMPDPALEEQRLRLIECWAPRLGETAPAELREKAINLKARAVAGEISLDQLRLGAIELIKAERPKAPPVYGSTRDTGANVIEAALCLNAGIGKPEEHFDERVLETAGGKQYRNFGLQQLLTAAAIENGYAHAPGERVGRGNLRDILQAALPGGSIRASGFSTLDVSGLLSNVANKMLLDGFNAAPQKWREVAATRTVSDFKQATAYRMTADLEYEELPPSGEIEHGTLGEESYTMQAKTYAKMLTLTREAIINDDLGAFDDLRRRLGIGAVIKMNRVFWTLWINNSTFFTAARGNYQEGAATALGEAGLNTAVKLFRDMQTPDGTMMDLEPAVLLVPSDLEATGLKLHNSMEVRDTTASTSTLVANIYYNRFKPVAVPQLGSSAYTGYSALAWYLLADPKILATAAMCFLDGQQSPTIESADADFNTLGIQLRGYHDWGVAFSEWRAGVKSKGEG